MRPGAMLVRQGWQGLNASSTSAQTSKAYSYDWLKATAHRHIGRGGPFPAGDRDADSCSGVRSNTYAVLLDCVEMLTSMHALDPDIASEVNAALTYQPQDALSCIGAAVCDAVFGAPPQGAAAGPTQNNFDGRAGRVFVRLVNLDREFRVSVPSVRAQSVGKLVSVVGVAVKVSTPRAIVERMDFCCAKCGAVRQVEMRGGTFDPPTRCGSNGCRSQKLVPVRRSIVCADWQKIRLQEMQQQAAAQGTQTAGDAGRIPCNLECEVRDGMIEQCCAGETVSIVGIVKTTTTGSYTSQVSLGGGNASMYSLYVDVISIEATGKGSARRLGAPNAAETPGEDADDALGCSEDTCSGDARSSAPPSTKFTERDLQFVSKFSQEYEGDQLRQLVHSLCPSILGQELVKMGMVLSMVGGVQKNADAKDRIQVRGDIHMLIVGDPGLGKSQMLKAATEASPRGVYVCGNGTTSTGLTASLGRDSDSGTFAFEAGALVLADRGVCCVDEFDKMTADRHALLEAMEQQTVSMAKAGLVASLPSRAAVIAAANPIKGHYDRSRTVNENIKLSNAMMSRFDLVFLLLDEPDAQTDKHLSEHLLALHSGNADRTSRAKHNLLECGRARRASHASSQPSCSPLMSQRSRIEDRMKLRADEDFCPLHAKLMRTYIAYVRKFVFPTLSQEAKKVIQEFYLELRASARPSDGTPITVRRHRVSIEARNIYCTSLAGFDSLFELSLIWVPN